ncbi:MAG: GTP-binding protein [Gammaproteobacteria bacterium]
MARIYHTQNSEIDLTRILDVGAFELEAKLEVDPKFLEDLEHEHDAAVGSFVLREERLIDINKFMQWMNTVAQERGEDLYRSKGVFYANGFQERLVFQSVRMLTTLSRGRPWSADEPRRTEFVVIGKNLDKQTFADGLASCVMYKA